MKSTQKLFFKIPASIDHERFRGTISHSKDRKDPLFSFATFL